MTTTAPGQSQKPLVLCIEDEQETLALLVEELGDNGFRVETARDGQEGFAAILRLAPDIVLCDINMPVMSGYEVLQKLTELQPKYKDMPFVFLTALADRDSVLKGRRLGADDYVTKPIDYEMLIEVIKSRLARVARSATKPPSARLSDREAETLTWSARGKSSAEIAVILGLAERTINFHITNAMQKLGVATRIQAAVKAASEGLISP